MTNLYAYDEGCFAPEDAPPLETDETSLDACADAETVEPCSMCRRGDYCEASARLSADSRRLLSDLIALTEGTP